MFNLSHFFVSLLYIYIRAAHTANDTEWNKNGFLIVILIQMPSTMSNVVYLTLIALFIYIYAQFRRPFNGRFIYRLYVYAQHTAQPIKLMIWNLTPNTLWSIKIVHHTESVILRPQPIYTSRSRRTFERPPNAMVSSGNSVTALDWLIASDFVPFEKKSPLNLPINRRCGCSPLVH